MIACQSVEKHLSLILKTTPVWSGIKIMVTINDVRAAELAMYDGTGYKPVIPCTGLGVGRVIHEPPYLSGNDETVLEPGMVVALEPTVQFTSVGDIFVCPEDQFLTHISHLDFQSLARDLREVLENEA